MGAYTEIVDFTFTANETSRTFSGLSITKDDFIKIVMNMSTPAGSTTQYSLFPNNNTTATNYRSQILNGEGSGVNAFRFNDNAINFVGSGQTGTNYSYLKLSENNKLNMFSNRFFQDTSSLIVGFVYTTSVSDFTNGITSLTLSGRAFNGALKTDSISAGSRIQIYKLAAEKVADFVTTSNSTQVDIPFPTGTFSPAIDKDSEYLLVGYIDSGNLDGRLAINDNITMNTYHSQRIIGNGSTTSASRSNEPFFASANSDTQVLFYAHIKLSNIGAYTYQCYTLRNIGTTTPQLINFFGSSTAENITSITKLNIVANTSNSIKAGSRFELYKLYE